MGALPIRSSDIQLFIRAIGLRPPAGSLLPPPETPASLSPSLRGGVLFFATHLRTSHGNLASNSQDFAPLHSTCRDNIAWTAREFALTPPRYCKRRGTVRHRHERRRSNTI